MTTSGTLTPEEYLAHLRADTQRMVEIAAQGLGPDVPACPGWTVGEALVHTGEVYSHKVQCMRLGARPDEWDHGPAEGRDPIEWFQERFAELEQELTSRKADDPTYTWHDDNHDVAFWYRRMAQETAVHRVDVESGYDAVTPVPDDLAIDGIDEILDWFLVFWHDEEVGSDGPGRGVVAVRTGDHIWRTTLTADAATLDHEPGHADAVVSGEPSELLLWLWGRRPDTAVVREGDDELLRGFRERLRLVTQ